MPKALLGFHKENNFGKIVEVEMGFIGYTAERVDSVDEMLEKMGIAKDSAPETHPTNLYEACLMDINLGDPGSTDVEPLKIIYDDE